MKWCSQVFVAVLLFTILLAAAHVAPAMYDAEVGRFITRDPIKYKGGINLYEYVRDNPTNRTDPRGLIPLDPEAHGWLQGAGNAERPIWVQAAVTCRLRHL